MPYIERKPQKPESEMTEEELQDRKQAIRLVENLISGLTGFNCYSVPTTPEGEK